MSLLQPHSHLWEFPWVLITILASRGSFSDLCPGEPKGIICLLDIYGESIVKVSVSLPSVGSINH